MTITREQWLQALGEADVPLDDSAMTPRDLAALLHISETTARSKAERLVADGRAQRVRKRVVNASGQRITVPAYKLKDSGGD